MEEKGKNTEGEKLDLTEKLNWEAPELYCLDKGKTESGFSTGVVEDDTYSNPAS